MAAAENGQKDIVDCLIARGANIADRDEVGLFILCIFIVNYIYI